MIINRTDLYNFDIEFNEHELNFIIDLAKNNFQSLEGMLVHAVNAGLNHIKEEKDSDDLP